MTQSHPFADLCRSLALPAGESVRYWSLPALAQRPGFERSARLPVSLRIVLEALLRHCDGQRVEPRHVQALANWQPNGARTEEIPFVVARVVLQDFTGVPLLCDLAAMRSTAAALGKPPTAIEPLVPVDLVVDHSVQIDTFGSPLALQRNMELEFARNRERYQFLKWGMQAFETFRVVPPGSGIVHQVNLEYLFRGVRTRALPDGTRELFPDTLVGTDSHTTMINGVGVVGWGVGGIEAEAAMLGQPVYFLTPDVVGVELTGRLPEGVTATDLVLTLTEMLRRAKVVGKFVEFFGDGAATLSVPDRATIANMAPEYGATMGFFPVDAQTVRYLEGTGRTRAEIDAFVAYFQAQGLFGMPRAGAIDYSQVLRLDLSTIEPSVAGPKRPQDRIALAQLKERFATLLTQPVADNGFNIAASERDKRVPVRIDLAAAGRLDERGQPLAQQVEATLGHGDVVIAAITSCTNTSNPAVLIAAGLLARKAVERGLRVAPHIKTSLAPGSRVVTDYLQRAGLLEPLQQLGFAVAGYGCTTCIGNAGDLAAELNEAIQREDLMVAAVLSGNRNFEARIHPRVRANFLASPPLVVAFALAGRVTIDFAREPIGIDAAGQAVYLKDLWPSSAEIHAALPYALDPLTFERVYRDVGADNELWQQVPSAAGEVYDWPPSTYIARPPFFDGFAMTPTPPVPIQGAKALLLLGDSVTTDHISPAGSISAQSPAGQWLLAHGVPKTAFNSYGARRGHHEVMIRGTFANVRLKNLMIPPRADGSRVEGGYTLCDGQVTTVFEAAQRYQQAGVPTLVFAGEEYGTGSSRDWAAKGTALLGVRAVVARSFERIHRANLVGMGVLPLQFTGSDSWQSLAIDGSETFAVEGMESIGPQQRLTLVIRRADGRVERVPVLSRIDTAIEVAYYQHGGILPYVLRQIVAQA
ncbi:aconitate hydratase AcnA [Tepidimonas charontis]|uniref:Aconitate hydratase n=1 Tax=Tepidimonas charontis TaxID=2267262 RepID=A0A554XK12_9BURK|nr:aconitate hydratase AcnA [Tepidimonas charontis]TSE36166.1 Aconitate hydratase A [Tepidimonas charontis]